MKMSYVLVALFWALVLVLGMGYLQQETTVGDIVSTMPAHSVFVQPKG